MSRQNARCNSLLVRKTWGNGCNYLGIIHI